MKNYIRIIIISFALLSYSQTIFCGNKIRTAQSITLQKMRIRAQKRARINAQMRARLETILATRTLQNINMTTDEMEQRIQQPSPILDILENM